MRGRRVRRRRTMQNVVAKELHPSIAHFIPLFRYQHLPPKLQEVSNKFAELAAEVMVRCRGPEATVALRKLLESKDAAVRACLEGGFAHDDKAP